jgi:tetratricopeptide (TPR) repeat protein
MPGPNDRSSSPSGGRGRGSSSGGKAGGGRGTGANRRGGAQTGGSRSGGRKSGGPPRKYRQDGGPEGPQTEEAIPGNPNWGGLARKGALRATHDEVREYEEKQQRRPADDDLEPEELARRQAREERRAVREQRQVQLRAEAKAAVERVSAGQPEKRVRKPRAKPALERRPLPAGPARSGDEAELLHRLLGPTEAKKALRKLRVASEAFESERFDEARQALRPLVELASGVPEVRELYGLTLYRMGRFRSAAKQLEEFRVLAASAEQNPVLMDCYRSQQRWADVSELWDELAEVSPSGAIVSEGRIVMASALADQGDVDGAVRLLAKGWKRPSRPFDHHLRRAYALADLYERSGDLPRARALFEWLVAKDRQFVDSQTRLRNLR